MEKSCDIEKNTQETKFQIHNDNPTTSVLDMMLQSKNIAELMI